MVYCVYSLESPRWGDSNENTQDTFMLKKIKKKISLLCHLTWRYDQHSIARNNPCLEHIFMVPKVLEPLKSTVLSTYWLARLHLIRLQFFCLSHFWIFAPSCDSSLLFVFCPPPTGELGRSCHNLVPHLARLALKRAGTYVYKAVFTYEKVIYGVFVLCKTCLEA